MTSPRRTKKSGAQCAAQNLDWDLPSAATGTVKRRSSCPEDSKQSQNTIFEVETPSDSSGTSRSIDDSENLIDIEQRISFIINENRSSQSNSESSEADFIIESFLNNPISEDFLEIPQNEILCDRSKTFIISEENACGTENSDLLTNNEVPRDKKVKDRRLKAPAPVKKLNKPFDITRNNSKLVKKTVEEKPSVLPVYSSVQRTNIDVTKKKVTSKLRLPFSPAKTMEKPKINFFQNKSNQQNIKPSPLLSSPVRRTISNEYVRLKFTNDTVIRRTIDGKSVPKITPKIQSIIPESPVDSEDPFLNLSPNKKYTVTVNNKVRCDKDNYVIFDPATGFRSEAERQSRGQTKSANAEKSRIPLKSPVGENSGTARKSANVSDTDSGILSPNSPVETSERSAYYVNAAAFSETAKKCEPELDITILDPALAKKAAEQIQVSFLLLIKLSSLDIIFDHYFALFH